MHVGQDGLEAGLRLVLLVERDLHQARGLAHEVDIAGQQLQVQHIDVVNLLRGDFVDVGQLLALGIDLEVVRVAFP